MSYLLPAQIAKACMCIHSPSNRWCGHTRESVPTDQAVYISRYHHRERSFKSSPKAEENLIFLFLFPTLDVSLALDLQKSPWRFVIRGDVERPARPACLFRARTRPAHSSSSLGSSLALFSPTLNIFCKTC